MGHPVTGQPVTSQLGTGHSGTSQQPFTLDFLSPITGQYITNQSPVIVPQYSYAPSISSHVSHGSQRRLPNIQHTGYEHSNIHEFPNLATSSRLILPLEPDFSQIWDPMVRIEPPNTLDQQSNYTSRLSQKEQSKRNHRSKKRKRHRLSSCLSTSKSSSLDSFRRSKKSERSRHSQRKRRR